MKPWHPIVYLILAAVTSIVIHNTLQYVSINDSARYLDKYGLSISTDQLIFFTNFLIFSLIGGLVIDATKSWRWALTVLLGFSVSLMTYFTLMAQAAVMIIAFYLWLNVDEKKRLIYLIATIACGLLHKFGAPLIISIWIVKSISNVKFVFPIQHRMIEMRKFAYPFAMVGFLMVAYILLAPVFQSGERVSFFYFFLLPMSLGSYDVILWFGLFGLIWKMLLNCEDNERELFMAGICFLWAAINYAYFSHLEIDIWRTLIFVELIAWVKIAQNQGSLLNKWLPIFFLLMGIERLMVGLIIGH